MLKIEELSAGYEGNTVISRLSFTFEDGKKYALIGASGIGKTTLINILSGLKKPSEGTVVSTHNRSAYVFQEPRLFPWLTALENIKLVCEDNDKAQSLLRRFINDDDAGKKYPEELSGGMKQRVAIARALAYDADIIFMDEPFRGLDEGMRKDVRHFVFEYLADKTVIMITHDMDDVKLCDTVLRMEGSPVTELHTEESGRTYSE